MAGKRLIILNVVCSMVVSEMSMRVDGLKHVDEAERLLTIFPWIRVSVKRDELRIKLVPRTQEMNDVEGKGKDDDEESGASKIATIVTMIPLIFQMFSLPAALASVKVSLLKSLLVGKLALAIMIFNSIRNSEKTEEVVVHRIDQQHIDHYPNRHYYNVDGDDDDDDNDGWFGRKRR